jgi:hypothetical protein
LSAIAVFSSLKQTQQRENAGRHDSKHGRGHVYLPHGADTCNITRAKCVMGRWCEARVLAEEEADKLGHPDIRNEHILPGLVESGNSFAAKLLAKE